MAAVPFIRIYHHRANVHSSFDIIFSVYCGSFKDIAGSLAVVTQQKQIQHRLP